MKLKIISAGASAALYGMMMASAHAADVTIGEEVTRNGMKIGAVYIQPVNMEPEHSTPAGESDIHLEADVHAVRPNHNGFPEGSWIPYLKVAYVLEQPEKQWKKEGVLMPMVADDGPHYGDNVKLNGPGKYTLTFSFEPPIVNGFMRHTDKETGVDPWWKPFTLHYEFAWIGSTGKKGGY